MQSLIEDITMQLCFVISPWNWLYKLRTSLIENNLLWYYKGGKLLLVIISIRYKAESSFYKWIISRPNNYHG